MDSRWKYLVINVTYNDSRQTVATSVSANYRHALSNITKEALEAYLNQLKIDGWKLIRIQSWNGKLDMAYYFKMLLG